MFDLGHLLTPRFSLSSLDLRVVNIQSWENSMNLFFLLFYWLMIFNSSFVCSFQVFEGDPSSPRKDCNCPGCFSSTLAKINVTSWLMLLSRCSLHFSVTNTILHYFPLTWCENCPFVSIRKKNCPISNASGDVFISSLVIISLPSAVKRRSKAHWGHG